VLHKNEIVNAWCLPFPGSDKSIVQRTERYFYHEENKRPIQINAYLKTQGFLASLAIMFVALMFGVMAQFKCGRYLLETVSLF
jgi:hypothetical protein